MADDKTIIEQRNKQWIRLFVGGMTLQEVGERYNVTRERVRQVLAKHGLGRRDGGAAVRGMVRRNMLAAKRNHRVLNRTGMFLSEFQKAQRRLVHGEKPYTVFMQFRSKTRRYHPDVAFTLTFGEWFELWSRSGKLGRHGRGKGKYVLARKSGDGPFSYENMEIIKFTHIRSRERNNKAAA